MALGLASPEEALIESKQTRRSTCERLPFPEGIVLPHFSGADIANAVTILSDSSPMTPMRIAAYLRVSTDQQSHDSQRLELEEYCRCRGWAEEVKWYVDTASGAAHPGSRSCNRT